MPTKHSQSILVVSEPNLALLCLRWVKFKGWTKHSVAIYYNYEYSVPCRYTGCQQLQVWSKLGNYTATFSTTLQNQAAKSDRQKTVINHRYALSISSDSLPAKHSKEIYLGMTERCFLAHPFGNNYVGINGKYRASKQHNCDFVVTLVLTKYRQLSNSQVSLHWSCAHPSTGHVLIPLTWQTMLYV